MRTVRRAEEEADRVLKRAEAEAHAAREAATADRDAFLAWHAVRNKLAPDEEATLATSRRTARQGRRESGRRGEGTVLVSRSHAC